MATKKKTTAKAPVKIKTLEIWDQNGLLKGVEYKFNDSGQVDWKSMVLDRPELLMPNKNWFFGKVSAESVPSSVEDMEDPKEEQLALTLKATHWLLNSRGYSKIKYKSIMRNRDKNQDIAVYKCQVEFKGNYETNFQPVVYEAIASASESNTDEGISRVYLDTIAQNRALSRAVRGFLNVNIVSAEEMSDDFKVSGSNEDSHETKMTVLEHLWNKNGDGDFDSFISVMEKEGIKIDGEGWEEINGKSMREAIGFLRKSV